MDAVDVHTVFSDDAMIARIGAQGSSDRGVVESWYNLAAPKLTMHLWQAVLSQDNYASISKEIQAREYHSSYDC